MPSFEPQNQSVRKQHATKIKNDKFTFHPQKDSVLSMPYQFVVNLELGEFTQLDKFWLKNVKKFKKKGKVEFHETIKACEAIEDKLHWKSNHVIQEIQ
jgi:hypothetical protein